ncbi:polysaccharide biosynthesis tyrosine autokinase, partial [Flavobacteriaceae bacterium]|nr:polysaccharide biosynthesis tyrosine autokinase [Flavobacteriaceae bacterium]
KEQGLLKYQKEYEFSEFYYSYFKQKKYEANAAIEASVSDVKVIDTAIDLGQKPIYPNPTFNYLVGIMLGIVLPLFYIIIRELLDNKIRTIDEIEKQYNIPILGAIGRNKGINNLVVFDRPKSIVAESFRALRSNMQFLFKNSTDNSVKKRAKTLLLTSSVSGEGKTMISINMATVFALSGKKTVLIGMDLRKPKIFDDFEFNNDIGVVNYLINQKTISEITIKTKIPNLDVILSGPIPPNPSELLISENCDRFIQELEKEYDYIVIDTPPIGLVSDALELFKYSDAICYVIRQDYSERGMNAIIDTKYKNKEVSNISYIFNDFKSKNKHGYGYGYGYGYSEVYGNGYHEEEEPETLIKKIASFIKPKK